jgi:arabinogalactan oligomer/maltooligosaccharide transport system permease protein
MFLVVQMFPATLLLLPLYVILNRLGLLNSIVGLVLVYATTAIPFCVWTLKGYFDSLPRELEEAARIDGASPWMIFRRIILPLARPGIAVTALFSFMTAWNEFIMASTFMTNQTRYTLPVLIQSSVTEFSADWGLFAAGAIVTSVPVMIAFYFLQKYLVGGLTAGAVKG